MKARQLVVAGVAALVVAASAGGFLWLRGGSTPVALEDTVRRYRSADSATTPTRRPDGVRSVDRPAPADNSQRRSAATLGVRSPNAVVTAGRAARPRPLPPQGVYRYATKGYDEVDALGGSRHTYPSNTTITVRHSGCGLLERWDVIEERWDERESCRSPRGDRLKRVTSYHEFFRHGDRRTLNCDGLTYPVGARPGDTWTMRCDGGATKATSTLRAVGYEDVLVDGRPRRALHVRVDTKVSGEQTGEGRRDVWGDQASGLVLRERSSLRSDSVQPALGRVTYHEEYEIRLRSLTPSR